MDLIRNISDALKAYFSNNRFFKVLLPLDAVLIGLGLFLYILMDFRVPLGTFISAFAYWFTMIGFILAFANYHMLILSIGMAIYALDDVFGFIYNLIRNQDFGFGYILSAAIFGLLAFFAYKRSMNDRKDMVQ